MLLRQYKNLNPFSDMRNANILFSVIGVAISQLGGAQSAIGQTGSNVYQVFVSAVFVTTNDAGRLAPVFVDNREFIRNCANDNGITDPRSVTLVYDRDADALEVVMRADGAVVCTPLTFSGGLTLTNGNGAAHERLAFVFANGSDTPNGTLRATERYLLDSQGEVRRFNLSGRLQ